MLITKTEIAAAQLPIGPAAEASCAWNRGMQYATDEDQKYRRSHERVRRMAIALLIVDCIVQYYTAMVTMSHASSS